MKANESSRFFRVYMCTYSYNLIGIITESAENLEE